jgi:hypothetical protein
LSARGDGDLACIACSFVADQQIDSDQLLPAFSELTLSNAPAAFPDSIKFSKQP